MRIVSLVPSATEMLFALGAGDQVVGVTHECDFPAAALDVDKVTRDRLPPGLDAREIDEAVRAHTEAGESIYELDADMLRSLQPDLIVTQALCAVCAVSADDVRAVAEKIESEPKVVSLDPMTFGEVLGDIRVLAQAIDAKDAGVDLLADCSARIDAVRLAVRGAAPKRVAALEWLDPVFAAGHWIPQMIEYAGGIDLLALPGERSEVVDLGAGAGDPARGRRRDALRLRRRARAGGGLHLRRRARGARCGPGRRRGRLRPLLASVAPAGRRARDPRAHPPPRPGARAAVAPARSRALSRLFVHSSAGRYGADRQLTLLAGPGDTVLLPFEGPLVDDLGARGAEVLLRPIPVLRRELLSPKGAARLARDVLAFQEPFRRLVAEREISLVHANTSVILGLRRHAPILVTHVREIYPPTPVLFAAHRHQILRSDAVIAVSHATACALGVAIATPSAHVVHDGLAFEPHPTPRDEARAHLGLPSDSFIAAVLGRISHWKGQELLARAMQHVDGITLVAGDAWPGQERHEHPLMPYHRVKRVGFQDPNLIYGAADVVVVPSTAPDPLPNTAIEAAAAGCCVVAADHGGLPEIITDGKTGRLVPPERRSGALFSASGAARR